MLRSFIDWLDGYLAGEQPATVVKAAIGIMSFAVLLGAFLGSSAVRLGALVVVLFILLSIALILLSDRRRLSHEIDEYSRIVTRYGDEILDNRKPAMRLKRLEHLAIIDRNGDAKEYIRMRVVALKKELHFIPHRAGPAWPQPASQLRKVKVEVRGLSVDGEPGTKWFVTKVWQGAKLHLLAHLNEPIPMGSEVYLEIVRDWPGKCIPLMRLREPDDFTYDYTRPVDHLVYTVILPPGVEVYCDPIGFTHGTNGFSLKTEINAERCTQVTLTASDVSIDKKIGMRLELR
ncbi:MAG TPA: hypothetical protein VHV74_22770 [Pseudonocardiaceae bacterium]|jgi:hypothetical protein|nr:hypothetical protein [Pseudonocardiaceae bacterium]